MIRSFVEIEQQHTFAAAVTKSWKGNLGPWTWEGGQQEGSLHLNCHSYSKIVSVSGCTAMAQVSEPKCTVSWPACISLIITCHAWWQALLNWSLLLLPDYLRKLGALEVYETSPRTASHIPYISTGEGAWESTMDLGFIGCEEHERCVLGFLCSLYVHFYFFTSALSPSFEPVLQGRAPSRCALRGCDWIHWKLPSQGMLWDVKGSKCRLKGVSPSTLQIL